MQMLLLGSHYVMTLDGWLKVSDCEGEVMVKTLTYVKPRGLTVSYTPLKVVGRETKQVPCIDIIFSDVSISLPKDSNLCTLHKESVVVFPITKLTPRQRILMVAFDNAYLLSEPEQLSRSVYEGEVVLVESDSPFLYGIYQEQYRGYNFAVCIA